ncbi:site-specific integrase [Acidobacteria bacterium AH-259-D05]|nr:site-specific integrase [Acidobacteria bacterium AH-259-D05]
MGVKVRERPKGSGIWYLVIDHKGERRSKKVGPNKKKAEEVADIVRANLLLGKPLLGKEDAPKVPTLNEYYKRFESTYMKTVVKETTYHNYEIVFRVHVLPELGKFRLDQIDRPRIEEFIAHLMENDKAKATIQLVMSALGSLYNQAIEHKLVKENPAKGVGKFYRQARVLHEEIKPLSEDEVVLFLQAAMKHTREQYPIFLSALHGGLCSGECAGLQWGDIDWNGKFVEIRRQVVRGKLTTLKTKYRRRRVDLSDELLATLRALWKQRHEEAIKRGTSEITRWVFVGRRDGEWVCMANVTQRYFTKALTKAGLSHIRFHELRHTFASLLLAKGAPITYVSRQLGHANPQITLRVYSHWIPEENQRDRMNMLPSINGTTSRRLEVSAQAK